MRVILALAIVWLVSACSTGALLTIECADCSDEELSQAIAQGLMENPDVHEDRKEFFVTIVDPVSGKKRTQKVVMDRNDKP